MGLFITAVAVVLTVSFVCSICESVLLSLSRPQIEGMVRDNKRSGRLLAAFKENIDVPIAAILILNTAAHTIGAAVAGASYSDVFDPATLWIFSLIFTLAVLLFTEIIPKTLGVSYAEQFAGVVAYTIEVLTKVLYPMVVVSEAISRSLRPADAAPVTSDEDIRLMAQLGRSEGVVGQRTADMIIGATELAQLDAGNVMLPRQEVECLSTGMNRTEVLAHIRNAKHSRFPLVVDNDFDTVNGIILVKELLSWLLENPGDEINWEDLHTQPLVVPESMSLRQLLKTFQDGRVHMAIVVNEYGEAEGIVTMEDVLEEIVGDIFDESDIPIDEARKLPDGSWQVAASIDLRKLCHALNIHWDSEEEAATLGGLIAEAVEHVPAAGDTMDWNGFRIEVTEATEKKAKTLIIRKLPAPPEKH